MNYFNKCNNCFIRLKKWKLLQLSHFRRGSFTDSPHSWAHHPCRNLTCPKQPHARVQVSTKQLQSHKHVTGVNLIPCNPIHFKGKVISNNSYWMPNQTRESLTCWIELLFQDIQSISPSQHILYGWFGWCRSRPWHRPLLLAPHPAVYIHLESKTIVRITEPTCEPQTAMSILH